MFDHLAFLTFEVGMIHAYSQHQTLSLQAFRALSPNEPAREDHPSVARVLYEIVINEI
jgi:hypothetical protein